MNLLESHVCIMFITQKSLNKRCFWAKGDVWRQVNDCKLYKYCQIASYSYGTNHPQLKRHTRVCRMCKSKKTRVASNHSCAHIYTRVKWMHHNTHLSIRSICHETILLTTSSASSFIIYACRTILGWIVTDILGVPRNTAFVAPCS